VLIKEAASGINMPKLPAGARDAARGLAEIERHSHSSGDIDP